MNSDTVKVQLVSWLSRVNWGAGPTETIYENREWQQPASLANERTAKVNAIDFEWKLIGIGSWNEKFERAFHPTTRVLWCSHIIAKKILVPRHEYCGKQAHFDVDSMALCDSGMYEFVAVHENAIFWK